MGPSLWELPIHSPSPASVQASDQCCKMRENPVLSAPGRKRSLGSTNSKVLQRFHSCFMLPGSDLSDFCCYCRSRFRALL